MLAACGQTAAPTPAPANPAAAPAKPTAAVDKPAAPAPTSPAAKPGGAGDAAGKRDVNLWHPWAVKPAEPITALTKEFNEKAGDLSAVLTFVPGDQLTQKVLAAISAGNPPEVMPGSPTNLPAFAEANGIKDLGAYAKPGDIDPKDIYPGPMEVITYKGKVIAVPLTVGAEGYYMNEELFKAAGLDIAKPPKSWDDLVTYAKALTKQEEKQWGWMLHNDGTGGSAQIWVTYLYQNGGDLLNKENTRAAFNGPEGVEALQFWVDMFNKYKVSPQAKMSGTDIVQAYGTGKVGIVQEYPFYLGQIREFKFKTQTAPLTQKVKPGNNLGGWYFPIFAKSKNPDSAWTYLMWLFKPENQYRLNVGMGNLPTKISTTNFPAYQEHLKREPQVKAFVDGLPFTRAYPALKPMTEITNILGQAMQEAVYAQATPKQALDGAAAKTNALLKPS